eukprot:TRINITY_DN11062_c0_g1_i6.p1 TRINITY_DN11062_c0_g1~~TRINITY_DN11062_c0_g1_i6.p1  ORF type:complete len:198 (+),score=-17.75 TRINITY_DN11062_c0_g1_i6:825-1418(+)
MQQMDNLCNQYYLYFKYQKKSVSIVIQICMCLAYHTSGFMSNSIKLKKIVQLKKIKLTTTPNFCTWIQVQQNLDANKYEKQMLFTVTQIKKIDRLKTTPKNYYNNSRQHQVQQLTKKRRCSNYQFIQNKLCLAKVDTQLKKFNVYYSYQYTQKNLKYFQAESQSYSLIIQKCVKNQQKQYVYKTINIIISKITVLVF